jgi:hypothetical protein
MKIEMSRQMKIERWKSEDERSRDGDREMGIKR